MKKHRGKGKQVEVGKKSLVQQSDKVAEKMAARGHKLFPKHQLFLCAQLAAGYNPTVVADLIEEKFGIKITPEAVRGYTTRRQWKQRINFMRRRYDEQAVRHPLMSKQVRLGILQEGINECLTWRLDKIHFDKDGVELARVQKRNIGPLPALIREARIEAEGETPLIDASQHKHLTIIRADGSAILNMGAEAKPMAIGNGQASGTGASGTREEAGAVPG